MLIVGERPKYEAIQKMAERYPELDASALEAFIATLFISNHLMEALDKHFARYEVSQGKFIVLIKLLLQPEGTSTPSELASHCAVTRATITGLLDGLERDGFVERAQHSTDRRALIIRLTQKGRDFLEEILPDHYRRIADLMSHLSENERKTLIRLMEKLNKGIPALREP